VWQLQEARAEERFGSRQPTGRRSQLSFFSQQFLVNARFSAASGQRERWACASDPQLAHSPAPPPGLPLARDLSKG